MYLTISGILDENPLLMWDVECFLICPVICSYFIFSCNSVIRQCCYNLRESWNSKKYV